MASVERRERNGQVSYRVRYRDPAGVQREKNFDRKRDAEIFRAENETAKVKGSWVDPQAGKVKFGKLAEEWFSNKPFRKPATKRMYRQLLDNQILPTFKDTPINAMHTAMIEDWGAKLSNDGLSASRTRNAYNVLSQILQRAVKSDVLARNVATTIDKEALPKRERTEKHYLTASQVETLSETIDQRYRTLILTASYTGLRIGELTALKVSDVDFLRRTIRVTTNDTEISGKLVSGSPKNGKARTVPVPAFLIDELAAHLAARETDPSSYIFIAPEGGRHRQSAFLDRYFHKAVVAAGLDAELDFHDLRHTAASLMVSVGANVKAVQNALGHASASMTLDVYAELFDTDAQAVAEGLDRVRRGATADRGAVVGHEGMVVSIAAGQSH
jgi:integrase